MNGEQHAGNAPPSFSRRRLLALGLGASVVILGGGGVWYLSARRSATPRVPPTPAPKAGTTLLTYTGHTAPVFSAAWSPDSTHIASASYDQTVQVASSLTYLPQPLATPPRRFGSCDTHTGVQFD